MEKKNENNLNLEILNEIKDKLNSLSTNEPTLAKYNAHKFLEDFQKHKNSLNVVIPLINSNEKILKFLVCKFSKNR